MTISQHPITRRKSAYHDCGRRAPPERGGGLFIRDVVLLHLQSTTRSDQGHPYCRVIQEPDELFLGPIITNQRWLEAFEKLTRLTESLFQALTVVL